MKVRDLLAEPLKGQRGHLSSRQAQLALGADATTLQTWLNRKLIPFEIEKAGKRIWRVFPVQDLPRLAIIGELGTQGVPIGNAVDQAELILDWKFKELIPEAVLWMPQANFMLFYTDKGKSILTELTKRNCASCILLSVEMLQKKIQRVLELDKEASDSSVEAKGMKRM